MNKSKQEIYCKYIDYLDDNYSDFRFYLDRTCTKSALKLPRDKSFNGITILVPDGKEIKAELEKALNSSDDNAWKRGPEILKNCIIYGHYPNAEDWKAQQDDIVTSNRTKLQIKEISGDSVTLEGGCKIVKDTKFRQAYPEQSRKVALWIIKSGIPVNSGIPADYKYASRSMASKKGSHEIPMNENAALRNRELYFHAIVSAYDCVIDNAKIGKERYRLPLLEYSASLISFIMNSAEYSKYLPDAMTVCNMGYSDIVFLLEPYCSITPLLPDALIDSWWIAAESVGIAQTYKVAFDTVKGSGAACFTMRDKITQAFNNHRMQHEASLMTFSNMYEMYNTLCDKNELFNVKDIFPDRVRQRYKTYPWLKLNEDDRRFYWEVRFMNMEQLHGNAKKDLADVLTSIAIFGQHKGTLNTLSTLVVNAVKARKHLTGALETAIMPVYYSNLALYIPGYKPLPDHESNIHKQGEYEFMDYNAYNLSVIEGVYRDLVPDINALNRMALSVMFKADRRYLNTGM